MKIRRLGGLRLELQGAERTVLRDLLDQFVGLLAAADPDDAAVRRLSPDAYPDDPAASAEFRELTGASAHDGRRARAERCRDDAATEGWIDLGDGDDARRWVQVLNDLRLVLGTRLGVRGDAEPEVDLTDAADPLAQSWVVYHWLTAMQDRLVTAMMR